MENYIVVFMIAVIAVIGVRYTVKHFRGEGGCCGGSSYKPKKKKLKNVLYQKTFKVEGMHCDHCKNRVEEVVNDVAGICGKADLKKGEVLVSYAEYIPDTEVQARIERAGYTVLEIKEKIS